MISLALLVSIIVLIVLISGPICFVMSGYDIIPTWFVVIVSSLTMLIGLWFFCLSIPAIRYIGVVSILLGGLSINNRIGKKTEETRTKD